MVYCRVSSIYLQKSVIILDLVMLQIRYFTFVGYQFNYTKKPIKRRDFSLHVEILNLLLVIPMSQNKKGRSLIRPFT